jgi:hypothetical protein
MGYLVPLVTSFAQGSKGCSLLRPWAQLIRAGVVPGRIPNSPGLVLALGLSRFAGSELDDRVETSKCALGVPLALGLLVSWFLGRGLSFGLFCSGALIRAGAPGLALRFKIRMCSDFAGPPTVPDRHRPCTNLVLLALKTARVFVVVDFPIVLFTLLHYFQYFIISYHIAPHFPCLAPPITSQHNNNLLV